MVKNEGKAKTHIAHRKTFEVKTRGGQVFLIQRFPHPEAGKPIIVEQFNETVFDHNLGWFSFFRDENVE